MEVYHYTDIEKVKKGNFVIGIGKFDGFHLGHQKIVERIRKISEDKDFIPSIFTFKHFPAEFYLYGWEEKLEFMEKAGIEICIWSNFEEISHWEAEKFLDFIQEIGVKEIVIGFNFHFGAHRKGDVGYLRESQKKRGFSLSVIEPVKIDGDTVNSSKIRDLLKKGDIEKVNRFLGREFSFKGKVITGSGRGKRLGFPTANLYLLNRIEIDEGVYAGWVKYGDRFYKGAINIGVCPTFGGKEKRVEVYILDFKKDIYGEILEVFLLKKIRNETYFHSEKELKERIKKDVSIVSTIEEIDTDKKRVYT